jgi:sporulation protein YlmC with PRC-barrel domain
MTKSLIALSAALGVIGAAAANAQTTTAPPQPQTPPPAATVPQPQASPPAATLPQTQMKSAQQQFLIQQQPGQMLASDLMNKSIIGANNQRIGDINDLLMSDKGEIVGVLVGVGGFLGIGEKTVAIPFDSVKRSPGTNQLTASFTREQLEQAPTFVSRSAGSAPEGAKAPQR